MKRLLQKAGIALTILMASVTATTAQVETDVTDTYLTNAALTSASGWTRTGGWSDISEGVTEAYGGWESNTNNNYSCKQTVTLLKGVYKLTGYAFYRSQEKYNTDPNVSLAYIVAGSTKREVTTLSSLQRGSYPNSLKDAATAFYTDHDYLNTLYFVVNADNTPVAIGYEGTHNGSHAKSWFVAGTMKLYKVDIASVSASAPLEIPVINPGFDVCVNGWTYTTGAPNHGRATNQGNDITGGYFENWKWESYTGTIHQSQPLPNGTYSIKAAVFRDQLINGATDGDAVYLYANNDQDLVEENNGTYHTVNTTVTGESLEYGIKSTIAKYRWMGIDNTSVKCTGIQLAYADALPSTSVTAGQWYAVSIPSDGNYKIGSSSAVTISYTQDGAQIASNAIPTSSFAIAANGTEIVTLSAGSIYLKADAPSAITVTSAAGPAIEDGIYFLRTDEGKFWLRGEPYGSAVQVYDWGMPVKITTTSLGATTLQFADASDWKIFSDGTGIYADNASHANSTWEIIPSGEKYIFKNSINEHFIKVDGNRLLSSDIETDAYAFTLVSPDDHKNVITDYINSQASTAATAAGLSATTPATLDEAVSSFVKNEVISGKEVTTVAEKWEGGQWDSRTIYSNKVDITTPGLYKFTMQGFYRMTDNATTYNLHTANADCPPVYVFFGQTKTPIKSVMDESSASPYNTEPNSDYTNGSNYYPNQKSSAKAAFQAGRYANTVWVYITEPGEYTYGIQYLGWAGSHSEWTCYTTESITLSLYIDNFWPSLQAALTKYKPYDDIAAEDDATGYTTAYNTYASYTESTPQNDMAAAITYMETHYANYQWVHASITHPVDVTEGIISGADCTSNDAWPGSGRTTKTGTYYDGSQRTYFTQNHENGPARSQDVTIPKAGAYLLRTIVRPLTEEAYATISVDDLSTTTRGLQTGSNDIGYEWAYNDVYFGTIAPNTVKTIRINLSNENNNREADCGEMHLYYIGQSTDFIKNGTHYYVGIFENAPAIELTDETPIANATAAIFRSGTPAVTFTNPNGLVFTNSPANGKNIVVDGTCSNLQLESGHAFVNPIEFTATSANYTMTTANMAGGQFATLMLPFNASSLPGTIYQLDQGADLISGTLRGTAVTNIEANKPVLVTKAGNYTGSNVRIPVVSSGATYLNGELVGVYEATTAPEGSYVLQNHTNGKGVAFYLVGSTKPTVGPFRAYIRQQEAGARAALFFSPEDVTGISSTMSDEHPIYSEGNAYDLQGRKIQGQKNGILQGLKRGFYIVNGKKMVVK